MDIKLENILSFMESDAQQKLVDIQFRFTVRAAYWSANKVILEFLTHRYRCPQAVELTGPCLVCGVSQIFQSIANISFGLGGIQN